MEALSTTAISARLFDFKNLWGQGNRLNLRHWINDYLSSLISFIPFIKWIYKLIKLIIIQLIELKINKKKNENLMILKLIELNKSFININLRKAMKN